ncbi:nitroreductase [Pseudomonas matsuisoli]|uniref:NADH dehydrogenase n=1 Tax=Pseudomonas matsuisoli TaxID=1515666 RepID=A0A917PIM3_9PSED|nr:nitroreductase [Pseudomonas matsuisoli]GGJ80667.1 NADH dehydrogenase [Pseudomonas matsuisoli]
MDVSDALRLRNSVRVFRDEPVDMTLLRDLLAQAGRAPSGGNLQPWRVYVLAGAAIERFRTTMAARLETNPEPDAADYPVYPDPLDEPYRSHRFMVGEDMYRLLNITREDKTARRAWFARNYRFFDAPCALFFFVERSMGPGQWADLGMFEQSLMLLLKQHGLDSCAQACWARYHRTVEDFLETPDGYILHCGMAIGYADEDAAVNSLVSQRMAVDEYCQFMES